MTRMTFYAALVAGLALAGSGHAQTAGSGSTTGTAQQQGVVAAPGTAASPGQPGAGTDTNSPKDAIVKPGQTLHNGPNAATGVSGSGNAGAGGGVAPGQQ